MRENRSETLYSLVLSYSLIRYTRAWSEGLLKSNFSGLSLNYALLYLCFIQSKVAHDAEERLTNDIFQVTRHCRSDIKDAVIAEAASTDTSD